MLEDNYKHKGQRKRLVEELEKEGIRSKNVLKALMHLPRHFFFPKDFENKAYENIAFPIEGGQTISQPFTVARQTELLDIQKGDKVLEVGTGSGYQTAVLIELKAEVYSIERHKELYAKAKKFLPKVGYVPKKLVHGDGYAGLPEHAPFDGIIVTAGAPYVPKALLGQLKIGGKMVIPVGDDVQVMTVFTRTGEQKFEKLEYGDFRFVPMLKEKNS